MKNNLAKLMTAQYEKGCRHGWNAFVMAFFIAVYNVNVSDDVEPDRYRWHDLNTDPDDLPTSNDDYLCCIQFSNGELQSCCIEFFNGRFCIGETKYNNFEVIAWKEIEPFKGADDEQSGYKYVKDGKITKFCTAVENELYRIFTEEMHRNPDAVELLTGTAIEIREKLGLEEEPQLWDAAYGRLKKDEDGRMI